MRWERRNRRHNKDGKLVPSARRGLTAAAARLVITMVKTTVETWLDLDQQSIEWTTLEDGHEAVLVNGGGLDGGDGAYFTNCGEDVHAVGSLAPIVAGYVGCIAIRPHGSRYLARAVPDPPAEPRPD